MPWQPLPDDVPLDHESLTPPPHMDEPTGKFAPLPDDVPLDQPDEATLVDRPKADDAPIIIGAIRQHGPKAQEVNPSYTEAGFDGEIHPDTQYHSQLSKEDKAEYAGFFKDPKSPPSAAALGLWYHQKTGCLPRQRPRYCRCVQENRQVPDFRENQHPDEEPRRGRGISEPHRECAGG
jgi:hypothetical protein